MTAPMALAALLLALPTASVTLPHSVDPAPETVQVEGEQKKGTDEEKKKDVKKKPRDVSQFNLGKKGLAIEGYDPVAYFKEGGGKAKKGDKKLTFTYEGATYRFVNQKNLDLFKKNPTRYEPMYGGWCSYAMASNDKVEVDEESFIVTEEGLFLFYKSFLANTKKKWNKEGPAKLKPKADKNWTTFLAKAMKKDKK